MKRSLSIAKKIWLSLFILIIGYFCSMVFGFYLGSQSELKLEIVAEYLFPATMYSQEALVAYKEQIKLYNDAVMIGEAEILKQAKIKADETKASLQYIIDLEGLKEQIIENITIILDKLIDFSNNANSVYSELTRAPVTETSSEVDYQQKAMQLNNETKQLLKELTNTKQLLSDQLRDELLSVSNNTKNQRYLNLYMFFIVVSLAVGFVYLIIRRSITQPLQNTVKMVQDIAEGEGDLTKRLHAPTQDEVGELSEGFNTFVNKLQAMIKDIAGNADTLNISSNDLAELSKLMAQNASQMSEKSETVANAVEEMNNNMSSIASAMEEAVSNTNVVASAAEQMSATINEISGNAEKARSITENAVNQSKSASERVQELGGAAQEIGDVTETITKISYQTNLLALNATIEAARAGDAGKGFAVVATEIKELSKQTAEATNDIKKRIDSIQKSTSVTVEDMKQIAQVIHDVNSIVSTIAAAVEEQSVTTSEIAKNVVQVSDGINEVTSKVSHSSNVIGQITGEISEVNISAGEISNSCSQMNINIEELSNLSVTLTKMVRKFKI